MLSRAMEVHPDLVRERLARSFDPEEVTLLLDGGPERTRRRRNQEEQLFCDPELQDPLPPEYMGYTERYSHYLRKACKVFLKLRQSGQADAENLLSIAGGSVGAALFPDGNPLTVHLGMFLPCLMGQGTLEQQGKFFSRAWDFDIVGTYAQTELGHGTFVRGLETTATYDVATQEFVLNTPTLTATKWWPGSLGKTANWAVVLAQLWTQGRCYGVHPFVVQLREEGTHRPLPGVRVGDIGARFGFHCNDNGFLAMDHVRIPRDHMLMRHAKVMPDGSYVSPSHDKLRYGTMVFVRVVLVFDAANYLKRAVTIATRYSAVRRQSELLPGEREPQVLDYQLQQFKLLPLLASCFAIHFAARSLFEQYNAITENMEQGDLERLPELHALSCGLKAVSTSDAAHGTQTCLLACGGHGYLAASHLPRIFAQATAASIYEGENTVLHLQVARYLVKAHRVAQGQVTSSSSAVTSSQGLLGRSTASATSSSSPSSSESAAGPLSIAQLEQAFQTVAQGLVAETSRSLEERECEGQVSEVARNLCGVQQMQSSQAHMRSFLVRSFAQAVCDASVSPPVRTVLLRLCELYALHWLLKQAGDFLRFGAVGASAVPQLQSRLEQLLALLRPDAVSLVDSLDLRDELLGALGAKDGRVYERLVAQAALSPLNQSDVVSSAQPQLQALLKSRL